MLSSRMLKLVIVVAHMADIDLQSAQNYVQQLNQHPVKKVCLMLCLTLDGWVCYMKVHLRFNPVIALTHKKTYGIIFWGNSPYGNNIFKLQKRAIRVIMNAGNRVSCHELCKKLNILPLHSQYILSLLLFVVKNIEEFASNSEVHSINSHHRSDFYPPSIKFTKYQKGVYYSGIKIFDHLPQNIKKLPWNIKKI
jgi:hypothetical protein